MFLVLVWCSPMMLWCVAGSAGVPGAGVVQYHPIMMWCVAGSAGVPGAGVQEEDLQAGQESTPQPHQSGSQFNRQLLLDLFYS